MQQLGVTDKITMKIELKSDKPVFYKLYRMSFHELNQIKDMSNTGTWTNEYHRGFWFRIC